MKLARDRVAVAGLKCQEAAELLSAAAAELRDLAKLNETLLRNLVAIDLMQKTCADIAKSHRLAVMNVVGGN